MIDVGPLTEEVLGMKERNESLEACNQEQHQARTEDLLCARLTLWGSSDSKSKATSVNLFWTL